MKIKKLICVIVAVAICVATMVSGILTARAQSYLPTTPIEYHNLSSYLFSNVTLTTGDNDFNLNDNWKYYYWCDFTPQYSADYTVTVTTSRMMKTELYDSQNNLLSSSNSEDKNENYKYVFSNTYFLEKGETYYYKFAFTGGFFNSCGSFNVKFESAGSPELQSDDHVHLYINDKTWGQKYELSQYTDNGLLDDLSLKVVYPDGTLRVWERDKTVFPYLDGCDIILDLSDCKTEVGVYTVTAYYKGYKSTASFEIVECAHEYEQVATNLNWLKTGEVVYKCSKCGEEYTAKEAPSAFDMYKDFENQINLTQGDNNYNHFYDVDNNGVVNMRDCTLLLEYYYNAEEQIFFCINSSEGDGIYKSELDFDSNGVINIRDFTMLVESKSQM